MTMQLADHIRFGFEREKDYYGENSNVHSNPKLTQEVTSKRHR